MPGGDRTGPMGMGPMTGRGAGYCAGYSVPGYATPIPGRGWGFGYGRGFARGYGYGRGFGRRFGWNEARYPYLTPYVPAEIDTKQEADMLREQAKAMQEEISAINQRIKELESATTSE